MVEQADCVLVFGAGLIFSTMSFGHSLPKVPLIQVDADRSHIGRLYPADVAVVGDARLAAEALAEALPPGSNADRPFRSDETLRFLAASTSPATSSRPTRRAPSIRGLSARRSRSCCRHGASWSTTPATSSASCRIFPCRDRATSSSPATSPRSAWASARPWEWPKRDPTNHRARRGRRRLPDDLGELETVVREDLPLVIVVMNDCAYGAELHFLKMRDLPVAKSVFPDVDYAPIAEAFGFQAATIRTLEI